MDKRTLIFVMAISLTFLGVDYFFSQRNIEHAKLEREMFKQKNEKELIRLEEQIAQKTAKATELPIATITADPAGKEVLTSGIKVNDSVLTVSWSDSLPSDIFVSGNKYTIAYQGDTLGDIALYEKQPESRLLIGSLPYFGSFPLQLITPQPELKITLGDYTDGHFSLPIKKKMQIQKVLGLDTENAKNSSDSTISPDSTPTSPLPGNSIVLMETEKGFLPVAIYQEKNESLIYLEQVAQLQSEIAKPKSNGTADVAKEQYYVLENGYQQVVFSNRGGAIVEINLPFKSEAHPESVVRQIGFDRQLVEEFPYTSYFPSYSYKTGDGQEHLKGKLGGYYPLLRRDYIQKGNKKSIQVPAENYALNIISEYPEMAELIYNVTSFDNDHITFEAKQRNRKITKTFSFKTSHPEAPYCFYLNLKVEGDSQGLWLTSGVPEVEWISNAPAPALKARYTKKGSSFVENLSLPKDTVTNNSDFPDWLCNSNGFFGAIMDPLSEGQPGLREQYIPGTVMPSRLSHFDVQSDKFSPENLPGYMLMLPLNAKSATSEFRIYAGPFAQSTLSAADAIFTDPTTGYHPEYIEAQSNHGWMKVISAPIAQFLLYLIQFFHAVTRSWGLSIILLTVALRVMLYPLNAWSTKSMIKMQEIGPETKKIQDKYKNDPKRMQLEIMNLYRERGVNPISGCFPLLIQLPFLIGMFDLLKSSFELRGAPFIPGWIDNLAAPDVVFSWTTPIFFIGNELHLLPILVGLSMFAQQRLMASGPKDANEMTEQQRQARATGNIMTVVITLMFYHFPSGLNIYWLSSTLLGMLQQWWMQKQMKNKINLVK